MISRGFGRCDQEGVPALLPPRTGGRADVAVLVVAVGCVVFCKISNRGSDVGPDLDIGV